MLSNNEKYIFTSELALAISNGLQVEEGLKMLVGFDADVSICAKKLEEIMKQGYSFTDALKESKEFDEYMIQMVVVGQSIGNLDVVFKELSELSNSRCNHISICFDFDDVCDCCHPNI